MVLRTVDQRDDSDCLVACLATVFGIDYEDVPVLTDGTITPSCVCASPGCTWHVMARLEGWGDH